MTRPATPHPCPDCAESPDAHARAVCDRRTFLRRSLAGAIGFSLGGAILPLTGVDGLSGLSALFANATEPPLPGDPRVQSIIVLWMNGGPSQIDTFDPKPGSANGGAFKAINTSLKGVQISEHMPGIAELMDRMALIRCMKTEEGNHDRARALMKTGFKPNPTVAFPGLGSIVTYERADGESPLPQNVAINGPGEKGGILGLSYDPLLIQNPEQSIRNLSTARGVTDKRVDRRIDLMMKQDELFRARVGGRSREADGHNAMMRKAVDLMRAEETAAFELEDETAAIRDSYGRSSFGQGCLMARRLVERGVRFVEVTLNGWDTHDDNFTRVQSLSGDLDAGMSALVRDLEERGLLDSTLVVCMGEFGRTPKINAREGRDHFPGAWSVLMTGGDCKRGILIGETSSDGMQVRGNSVKAADLFRTILWSSGIDPDYEYYAPSGRPVKYADGGRLITSLVQG